VGVEPLPCQTSGSGVRTIIDLCVTNVNYLEVHDEYTPALRDDRV